MNYLVLSNRALLLENHWMLFHGNEKIKTNKPQKHKLKKKKRDPEEVSAWLKRAPTETSSEICLITKVLLWAEQHEKSSTWFTEASLITHHTPPHHPKRNWWLAWLWPHRLPCTPHAQLLPLLQGTQPPSLFWTTACFHHSLEFKVEDWGRPMLFTYQSLKNCWIKISSISCDLGFSASLAHILCAGQGKSWGEFLWRTDKAKVLTFEGRLVKLLWRTVWRPPQNEMKKRATIQSSNPTAVHVSR